MNAPIAIANIDIPDDRARDLDPAWAAALAGIIAAQGLTNPVTVRPTGDRYRLVTGLHRLEAFRINAQDSIPARLSNATSDDEARLEEVMENLGRHELRVLDKAHHLFEFQQVYERLYPDTKHGGDRKSEKIKTHNVRFDPNGKRHDVPLDPESDDAGGGAHNVRSAIDSAEEPIEVFGFARATAEKPVGRAARSNFMFRSGRSYLLPPAPAAPAPGWPIIAGTLWPFRRRRRPFRNMCST